MKRKRWLVIVPILAVLAAIWVWRYISLNEYYKSFQLTTKETHSMHEKVDFGDNWIQKGVSAEGYSLEVISCQIQDYETFIEDNDADGQLKSQIAYPPEKLLLLHVILFNQNSDAEGVMLIDLQVSGIDNIIPMEWDALIALNPILEGNYGISLAKDSQCELILPYALYKEQFGGHTWRNIEDYAFELCLTRWPTEKRIALSVE